MPRKHHEIILSLISFVSNTLLTPRPRYKPTKTSLIIDDRLVMKQRTFGQKLVMMESRSRVLKRSYLMKDTIHFAPRPSGQTRVTSIFEASPQFKRNERAQKAHRIMPNRSTWGITFSILNKGCSNWVETPINCKGSKALPSPSQMVHVFKRIFKKLISPIIS